MTDLPIVCSLDGAEIRRRQDELLPALFQRVLERQAIEGGYRLRFAPSRELLDLVVRVIDAERRCCRFLRFHLTVEPDEGPMWLDVTGPEGTAAFLDALLSPLDVT